MTLDRLSSAIHSVMIDFQEAQAVFTGIISIAIILTLRNYETLSQKIPVLSYMANMNASQVTVAFSFSSLLVCQVMLHLSGRGSGCNLFYVIFDWILSKIILSHPEFDALSYWERLKTYSLTPGCGNNAGPMSYCGGRLSGHVSPTFNGWEVTWGPGFANIVVPLLIADWVRQIYPGCISRFLNRFGSTSVLPWLDSLIPSLHIRILTMMLVVLVYFLAQTIMSLQVLLRFYSAFYASMKGLESWSFGQLVAVTVWLPVFSKFIHLLICKYSPTCPQTKMTENGYSWCQKVHRG